MIEGDHQNGGKEIQMAKVKDPVCNMECDEKTATKVTHKGKTYHFCSDACKRSFQDNPEKYAK